ncbi:MAG: aminotransferase class IV [Acidiferrobacterales bacterium]
MEITLDKAPAEEALANINGVAFIAGSYCPIAEAKISLLDWGFLRSDATYDVVHVWQGRFFRLDKHLDRFLASVTRLRLTLPYDRAQLTDILAQCVRRAQLEDAYVEMICTRGMSPTFSRDPRDAINQFIAFAIPFGWIANEEQRQRGMNLAISTVRRIPPESVDPKIKNYHWLDFIQALFEAYDRNAENVVLLDTDGNVTEGPGFNLFVVKNGAIATPVRGVLEGITRHTVIELCAELGIDASKALVPVDDLRNADEVFISSTAGGIMSITSIDGMAVGNGDPGSITTKLTDLYWQKHSDPDWTTPID